jgi:hypothetical protein
MSSENDVQKKAQEAIKQTDQKAQVKQMVLWFSALIVGGALGWLNIPVLNDLFNFVATVFTRLFQFVAVPTIALAVITTLATLGTKKETGRILVTLWYIPCLQPLRQRLWDWPYTSLLHRKIYQQMLLAQELLRFRINWGSCPIMTISCR